MTTPGLVVCAHVVVRATARPVCEAAERGWSPVPVPTDASRAWLDPESLHGVTVLDGQRAPGDAKRAPSPAAIAVVPATFNTLTGWANGRANTLPLVTLCAALGARVPCGA